MTLLVRLAGLGLPLLTLSLLPLVSRASGAAPVVAVFDLENRAKLKSADTLTLTEYITTRLAESGTYRVVPKGEVQSALRAKKAESYQTCYDESCQIEVGRELAAQKTLSSKVSRLGATCIVTVQLYDLAQGASEGAGTAKGGCKVEEILGLLDQAMAPLTRAAVTASRAPTAVAPTAAPVTPAAPAPKPEPPAATELPPELKDLPMPEAPAELPELSRRVRAPVYTQAPRKRPLLAAELHALKRLLDNSQKDAPDRPQLLLRLGFGYGELEAAALLEAKAGDPKARAVADAARDSLIDYLSTYCKDYPQADRADEAYYAMAFAAERAGKLDEARKVYYFIVQKFPASKYIPLVYLAFGELFWDEGKDEIAQQAYDKAFTYAGSPIVPYAKYRLALVAARMQKREQAIEHLVGARSRAEVLPSTVPWKADLLALINRALKR